MTTTAFRLRLLCAFALCGLSGAAVAATARADRIRAFHSPSGAIRCAFFPKQADAAAALRCDVSGATTTPPKRPASCEFDYGFSFGMAVHGRSRRLCVSDATPSGSKLAYGKTWKHGGFTCTSKTSGVRCTNLSHHGFSLSRQRQRRF